MASTRRQFTPEQKVGILREHLLDQRPVSDVCDRHHIQVSQFYLWQKEFFENGQDKLEGRAEQIFADRDRKLAAARERRKQKRLDLAIPAAPTTKPTFAPTTLDPSSPNESLTHHMEKSSSG